MRMEKESLYWRSELREIGEESSGELFEIKEEKEGSLFSIDVHRLDLDRHLLHQNHHCVYVGVGKSQSSMDAVVWAIKHSLSSSSTVCLLHVFPETRFIPSPLGKLPKSQVSPKLVESYMAQERGKKMEILQKFVDVCSSAEVEVDTLLIESDMVAKALLYLIPILNIRMLVLGTSKSRKWRSKRGNGTAEIVYENAEEFCDVKIICDGKDVGRELMEPSSPASSSPSTVANNGGFRQSFDGSKSTTEDAPPHLFPTSCLCFTFC